MTKNINEFVKRELTDFQRQAIIGDHRKFEKEAQIGDCILRRQAYAFMEYMGMDAEYNIVLWMNDLANACYRYYAEVFFETNGIIPVSSEGHLD